MTDELSARYADLLDGTYDCVDRIVLNGYHSVCYSAGGFRLWWRSVMGGSEEQLDNAHLMRLAGRALAAAYVGSPRRTTSPSSTAAVGTASMTSPRTTSPSTPSAVDCS
jgi:hypothetical protein